MDKINFMRIVLLVLMFISTIGFGQDFEKGKTVFTTNCAGCHNMEKNVVGPALQDVVEAQGRDWTEKWIKNSTELIASGDAHAVDIFNQYNKMPMPAFSYLPKEDLTALLDYMEGYKKDKETKAAQAPPTVTSDKSSTDDNSIFKGFSPFMIILTIITLVLLVVTGILVVITLKLLVRHSTKVRVINQQLMSKLKLDDDYVDKSVEKLFNDEVDRRMKEKIQSLKSDINDKLKKFE